MGDTKERRRGRRVSFLVNVWLNYRPLDVNPFPSGMLDKLSDNALLPDRLLCRELDEVEEISVEEGGHPFEWPIGDDGGVEVNMPLLRLRGLMKEGGSARISWKKENAVPKPELEVDPAGTEKEQKRQKCNPVSDLVEIKSLT